MLKRWLLPFALAALVAGWLGYRSGSQTPLDAVKLAQDELNLDLESSMIQVNDIRLHVVQAGPRDGIPVVLLHGYPEFWWGWRKQIARLARAGYRVIVPDQRGYNASDKPDGVEAYRHAERIRDISELIGVLGYRAVNLAGHDMGAYVSWLMALEHPDQVSKLMIFSVGHPMSYEDAARSESEQETISWYRTFFQLPVIPEIVGRFANWALLVRNMRKTSREGTFSDADMNLYRYAWDRDGSMHYMINWYRAGYRYPYEVAGEGRVGMPTSIVWGSKDAFSEPRLAQLSLKYCERGQVVFLPDAGHWLLHEEGPRVTELMLEFIGEEAR